MVKSYKNELMFNHFESQRVKKELQQLYSIVPKRVPSAQATNMQDDNSDNKMQHPKGQVTNFMFLRANNFRHSFRLFFSNYSNTPLVIKFCINENKFAIEAATSASARKFQIPTKISILYPLKQICKAIQKHVPQISERNQRLTYDNS